MGNPGGAWMSEPCPKCRELEARIAELERRVSAQASMDQEVREFKALRIIEDGWGEGWGLRPSPVRRAWMSEHPTAYQCLPMTVANQWGWQVLSPADVRVVWDGRISQASLRVEVDPQWAPGIKSQFGRGIVTFSLPWVFRTPPGWDLYVKGPSNRWKANAAPLEGVVETWWLNYTFTLNWKLVEPGEVWFAKGESVGQLVPVPHATFERSSAIEAPINAVEPKAGAELLRWLEERRRIKTEPVPTHRLYLKAEEIEGHLSKVPVPPFVRTWKNDSEPG
jgi:hypothetical protein